MPPKVWHAEHEAPPEQMPEEDKRINEGIADWLVREVMGGKPGYTLDVGSSYPYLVYSLKKLGCRATGIDGDGNRSDLNVTVIRDDFETAKFFIAPCFDLCTFVHSFEHMYDPIAAMRKLRRIIADNGAVFIRMPDNQVQGIERDLTPGHYTIHPFVHALSSIAELCARTGTFRIERTYELLPGQRDILLRPITDA